MHCAKFALWEWFPSVPVGTEKSWKRSRLQKLKEGMVWEEVPKLSVKSVGNGRVCRNIEVQALI